MFVNNYEVVIVNIDFSKMLWSNNLQLLKHEGLLRSIINKLGKVRKKAIGLCNFFPMLAVINPTKIVYFEKSGRYQRLNKHGQTLQVESDFWVILNAPPMLIGFETRRLFSRYVLVMNENGIESKLPMSTYEYFCSHG